MGSCCIVKKSITINVMNNKEIKNSEIKEFTYIKKPMIISEKEKLVFIDNNSKNNSNSLSNHNKEVISSVEESNNIQISRPKLITFKKNTLTSDVFTLKSSNFSSKPNILEKIKNISNYKQGGKSKEPVKKENTQSQSNLLLNNNKLTFSRIPYEKNAQASKSILNSTSEAFGKSKELGNDYEFKLKKNKNEILKSVSSKLWLNIFDFMNKNELTNVGKVNVSFNTICKTPSIIRKFFEPVIVKHSIFKQSNYYASDEYNFLQTLIKEKSSSKKQSTNDLPIDRRDTKENNAFKVNQEINKKNNLSLDIIESVNESIINTSFRFNKEGSNSNLSNNTNLKFFLLSNKNLTPENSYSKRIRK